MAAAIAGLGRQFVEGYDAGLRALGGDAGAVAPATPARPDGIAVCGMGGSAIGGEVVLATAGELAVPAAVVRGYDLPAWVRPTTLVVAVSYSGETEETLACVETALSRGCRPVCVASGGRLAAIAAAEGLPAVSVPAGLQPRAALGVLATPVAAALAHAGLCADLAADVAEAEAVLDQLASDLAPEVPEEANGAKALARRLAARLVLACGAGVTTPVARRWKTQVNENAKAPAFWAELPELDHNEIEGWSSLPELAAGTQVVLLEDPEWPARLARRAHLTAAELAAHGAGVERLTARGSAPLARAASLIGLGDWVSYYLALLYGVDPTPVAAIESFKRRLAAGE
ncbi:MAG TPA: bifunctional phosphoglucose/phosphomannose isomerase [Thermoleophilia bacterium]|nr:bifunctional phosphoglucose/phosphomannose isomerase [Thermoleophilia bacterium]